MSHNPMRFLLALALTSSLHGAVNYFRHDGGVNLSARNLPTSVAEPQTLSWRTETDSGHSSPIIHGGKLFFTTFNPDNRELATVALDAATGHLIWRRIVAAREIEKVHAQTGSAATPTPACDGERVYSFFGSYGLVAYDLGGQLLWDRRMGPFQDEYGAGSSPVICGDKVIIMQDHDVDNFIMAIDRSTGRTLWKTARPEAVRSYSSPVIWNHGERVGVLAAGALELACYDAANGEKLWWVNGLARIVIPVPCPSGEMVYMASWAPGGDSAARIILESWSQALTKWDTDGDQLLTRAEVKSEAVLDRFFRMDMDQDGKLTSAEWDRHAEVFRKAQNALLAIRPEGRGELKEKAILWKHQKGVPYVASPLVHDGIVWMVKDGGIVTKLEAASGKILQEERLPGLGGYYASPVWGDGKVYFASEQGILSVLAARKEWEVLSSHPFQEKIYATPAIEGDSLYVRSEKAVYRFRKSSSLK